MQMLTALDLAQNELRNAAVQSLAAAPSDPVKFQLWGDSANSQLKWWDGTAWKVATATASYTPTFGPVAAQTSFGQSASDGVATDLARSDHKHGTPAHDAAAHAAIKLSDLAAATSPISGVAPTLDAHLTTRGWVNQRFTDLVGAAPAAFDTLEEIAAELASDNTAAGAITTQLADHETRIDALEVAPASAHKYEAVLATSATSYALTHNLNTRAVTVEVYRNSTPWDSVTVDVERTSVNQVTLRFATAPAANAFAVVVVG